MCLHTFYNEELLFSSVLQLHINHSINGQGRKHVGSIFSLQPTNGWWSAFDLHIRVIKDINLYFCSCSEKTPWSKRRCVLTILMLGTFMLTLYIFEVSWPLKFWTKVRSSQSYDDDSVSIFSQLSKWLRQRKTHIHNTFFPRKKKIFLKS